MTATTRSVDIAAPPERVFDAIGDARTYPSWLVGARRIRRVDDAWPAKGSAFHHAVGVGPIEIQDRTTVVVYDRPRELQLRAGVGPLGAALVRFVVEPGSGDRTTRLTLGEEADRGVLRLAWHTLGRPLMKLGLWGRNALSLEQLKAYLEAGGSGAPEDAGGGSA